MHNADFRLLIVDDSEAMALTSQSFLAGLPVVFRHAKSVDEALDIVRTEEIDMLLLDYQLGNGNGDQVCQGLMQIFPDVGLPTVVMSADVAALDRLNQIYPFVYSRLPKPFRREAIHTVFTDLIASLRALLEAQDDGHSEEVAAAAPEPVEVRQALNGHAGHPAAAQALAAGLGGGQRSDAFAPPGRSANAGAAGEEDEAHDDGSALDEHLRSAAEEALAGVRDEEEDEHPNAAADDDDPPVRRIIAPRAAAGASHGAAKGPPHWSLPVPPSRRRPEVPAAVVPSRLAASPVVERASVVTAAPAPALWRFPLHLAGGGENALRWLADHSKVRGLVVHVSLTTEHSVYHVWLNRGAIAGFSSNSVPAKFRPRDMAPDLLATLLAEQTLGTDPVAALAGPPEAFQAYQAQLHDEVMTLTHGVAEAREHEKLPKWCQN